MRPMVSLGSQAELRRRLEARAERDELRQQNEQLQKQVVDKDKTIAHREKQIADLERQLAAYRKDTNSSKPPRRIGPKRPKKQCYPRTKRANANPVVKRDTQANTVPGAARAGRPNRGCGRESLPTLWERFAEARRSGLPNRGRRAAPSVMELPPLRYITEYECPKVVCLLPEWHACAAAQGGPERLWTSVSGFGRVLDCDVPDAPPGGGKRTGIGAGNSHQPG